MAFRTLRFLGFLRPFPKARYSPRLFSLRFLSIDLTGRSSINNPDSPQIHCIPESTLSERFVLQELSDLLSFDPKPLKPQVFTEKPVQELPKTRVTDGLLSADEKLRGIFIQNLKGKSAVDAALSATGVDLTAEIFADVVNKGNLGGESMVSFFDWAIEQPNLPKCIETYNAMLKALGRRKFFGFLENILLRMRNSEIKPNSKTLEILIDSLVRARRVSRAVQLFGRLEEVGLSCDCHSFNIILQCLCRRSHVKVANSLFNSMKAKIPFDNMTYNEIIGGWAKFGRVDKVESYQEMMMADGLIPDCVTFTHLIDALGKAGRIDDAIDVFEKLEEKGCPPDTRTYNSIISNCISLGDLEASIKYYKRMPEKNCLPDLDTYHKLISALLKVRRVADALELFDEMLDQRVFPTTGMITSFMEPLCSFGPPHAAMLIYQKSREAGCRISIKAYKLLLMRLSRFGKCGMVLKVWEEMQESGHASDKEVYEYIVNGLCNIGQVDNAVLVVEESLRKGLCLGKIVYSKLNSRLMEMNKVETAYKLFLKVKSARNIANSQSFWRANGWHF